MTVAIRCLVAGLAVLAGAAAVRADDVDIKVVKLGGLADAVAKHKGKVVVVDFWATYCVPCKAEFPNLVKMHRELGRDGVVAVSVTVDDAEDKAAALKFLREQKAAFENYLLDEPVEAYQKALGFGSVPTVLVYGKDGKLAKKFNAVNKDTAFTYKDVRKLVEDLVSSK